MKPHKTVIRNLADVLSDRTKQFIRADVENYCARKGIQNPKIKHGEVYTLYERPLPEEVQTPIIETIENTVFNYFDCGRAIYHDTTDRKIVYLRKMMWYFMRRHSGLTFNAIGAFFGGRAHCTVIAGCQTIEGLKMYHSERQTIELLGKIIKRKLKPYEKAQS
jgi:chromosomal replication initiation ATPase DnaA